ncbi:DUF2971 domain-containing protein [Polaromonas sp. P1-6]|nr:DUF2971 domain-containing protein [Polaromonas sp. P1-6]
MSKDVSAAYDELFHYTGASGLTGIITTGTLWVTHAALLNDQEEYHIFFDKRLPALLRRAIDVAYASVKDRSDVKRTMKKAGGVQTYKERTLSELIPMLADRTRGMNEPYVLSFCASTSERISAHGLLSQWRGYGKDGGYAIAFDTAGLEALWRLEAKTVKGMPIFMGDVEYFEDPAGDVGKHPETSEQTEAVVQAFAKFFLSGNSEDLELVFDPIHQLACLTKHCSFSEENEVRLVFSQPSRELFNLAPTEHALKPVRHFIRDGVPVPYMAVLESLAGGPAGRLPIKRIIVGPHPDREARKTAVQTLLSEHRYQCPVHVTDIPYRGR